VDIGVEENIEEEAIVDIEATIEAEADIEVEEDMIQMINPNKHKYILSVSSYI